MDCLLQTRDVVIKNAIEFTEVDISIIGRICELKEVFKDFLLDVDVVKFDLVFEIFERNFLGVVHIKLVEGLLKVSETGIGDLVMKYLNELFFTSVGFDVDAFQSAAEFFVFDGSGSIQIDVQE